MMYRVRLICATPNEECTHNVATHVTLPEMKTCFSIDYIIYASGMGKYGQVHPCFKVQHKDDGCCHLLVICFIVLQVKLNCRIWCIILKLGLIFFENYVCNSFHIAAALQQGFSQNVALKLYHC